MQAELHEVTFETMTYGGEALAHLADGRAVFVPFALPGERARIRLVLEKPRFARGELVTLLETSQERITPRCKHFGICGGCHYQHMRYQHQLKAKADILRDQLRRIGGIKEPPVESTVDSPDPWNYRNQVQFHVRRDGKLGYVSASAQPEAGEDIVAIEECHLPEHTINSAWSQVQMEASSGIERVSIRSGEDDEVMVILEGGSEVLPELELEADASIVHMFEDDCILLAGTGQITINVRGRDFAVAAPSFFQVNRAVAAKMVDHVLGLTPEQPDTIWDVYCGVGLFSAFLAPRARRLICIEESEAACKDFETNLDDFENVELYEAPAEDVLPALEVKPDLVVLDPPRAGLGKQVLEALQKAEAARVIYVSCDPSTLARDLKQLLQHGYKLSRVTPFDMFPQTFHIECVSLLERA